MQWIAQGLRKSDASESVMVVEADSEEQARVEASRRGLLVESAYPIGAKTRRSWWPLISLLLISSCFAGLTWTQIQQRRENAKIEQLRSIARSQAQQIEQQASLIDVQGKLIRALIDSSGEQIAAVDDAHRRIDVIIRALR